MYDPKELRAHLALDAAEVVRRHPHLRTVAVRSQDSDLAPLLRHVRAGGCEVALVTVGRPAHAGMTALRTLAHHHVVYDQALVDAAGRRPLAALIGDLERGVADGGSPSLRLDALGARMVERLPGFCHHRLGFPTFRAFVAACAPDTVGVGENALTLAVPVEPPPRPAPTRSPPSSAGWVCIHAPRVATSS